MSMPSVLKPMFMGGGLFLATILNKFYWPSTLWFTVEGAFMPLLITDPPSLLELPPTVLFNPVESLVVE